jgi:aspartyl-tRNA(Asn)/glutamyl-tRNA(Gln) amidotransferase subunit C
MTLTRETVANVARLAHIEIDDSGLDRYAPQLSNIMDWIEQLGEVDTADISPVASATDMALKMRKDEVTDGKRRDDILANAPESKEGYFVVQKIIE